MFDKKVVVALGGNALQKDPSDTSAKAQLLAVKETARTIVDLVEERNQVTIVHGNGPQVGQIVSAYERMDSLSSMPLPECGAMSQGYIGYHLQQAIGEELRKRGIKKQVISMITQTVVDKEDPAFKNPVKPIGSFFTEEEAKMIEDEGHIMKEDAGRGFRRVVASPEPIDIVEADALKTLVNSGFIVIAAGGGGIPVTIGEDGSMEGADAVIDKDLVAALVGEILDADIFVILTSVEKVYLNFDKSNKTALDKLTVKEILRYRDEGHFAEGSMFPKIRAATKFVDNKEGRISIITSLDKAKEGIELKTGTIIQK